MLRVGDKQTFAVGGLILNRKLERITRYNGQIIVFSYDGMQNRIMKAVRTGVDTVFTFYVRDAQGNVMGVYNRKSKNGNDTITWAEQHIYGSGRLGSYSPGIVWTNSSTYTGPHFANTRKLLQGQKRFELSNHLGNVLTTINDRRTPHDTNGDFIAEYYEAVVLTANDYYPFGMEMPGRTFALSSGYRYGFNGKEKDPSEFGSLTHYDYGFRIYNPAIAKFLSVDPLRGEYPWYTPYQFAGNMPIWAIDLDGLEPKFAADKSDNAIHYAPKDSERDDPYAGDKPWIASEQNLWVELQGEILSEVVVTAKAPVAKAPVDYGAAAGKVFKPLIDIGGAIKKEGDELEVVGFGMSVEAVNGSFYGKVSAERFSTTPENGASRFKGEVGVRGDGSLSLESKGPNLPAKWEGKNAKWPKLVISDNTTVETRFYFHASDKPFDPAEVNGLMVDKAFSITNTYKVPLFRFGGVFYSYDVVAQKNELGFYFSRGTTKQDSFKFKTSGTVKIGAAIKSINNPNK